MLVKDLMKTYIKVKVIDSLIGSDELLIALFGLIYTFLDLSNLFKVTC